MSNQNNDLPLYNTFNSLKKNGFDLGIEEYYIFLDALLNGFRFDATKSHFEKENLRFLARTVWLKPTQSKHQFEKIFNDTFEEIGSSSEKKQEENKNLPKNEHSKETPEKKDESIEKSDIDKNKTSNQKEHLIKFILGNTNEKSEKSNINTEIKQPKRNFLFTENYFDISQRQIKQSFRSLPIFQSSSASNEINIEATLHHWAKKGFFEKPIFYRKKSLYNNVVLLTDNKGSMLSFRTAWRYVRCCTFRGF